MASIDRKVSGPLIKKNAFVHKLYDMLNNSQLANLIWWSGSPEGHTFSLKPTKEFAKALNGYFKHGNIASFVRQLHMYGFHKVSDPSVSTQSGSERAPIVWEFRHSSGKFKKDDETSLVHIKRRSQSTPSRNPVIDNSGQPSPPPHMNYTGPPTMGPYHSQPPIPSPNTFRPYVPYHSQGDSSTPYTTPMIPVKFSDQGYLPKQDAHYTPHKSTINSHVSPDPMIQSSNRNHSAIGGFNGSYFSSQHYVDSRGLPMMPSSQPLSSQQAHEVPPSFMGRGMPSRASASSSNALHGLQQNEPVFSPHHTIPPRQPSELYAQGHNLDYPVLSDSNSAIPASDGEQVHHASITNESTASSFAPKPSRMPSLSSYVIASKDSSSSRNEDFNTESATFPPKLAFRRPFDQKVVEKQRNPSLLFDPLTVVGKNSPKPQLSSKGSSFDIKLPPLGSLPSPLSKHKEEETEQVTPIERVAVEKFPSRSESLLSFEGKSSRQNSQTVNSLAGGHSSTHSISLSDKIRPSLTNLHSTSQSSLTFSGMHHGKAMEHTGSHSSSLFSNGSSISSSSTTRSSIDSVSYQRKSSYLGDTHEEEPPVSDFRKNSAGLASPPDCRSVVKTISEEASDCSTIDSRYSEEVKTTPSQAPKLEYLVHASSDETCKQSA